MCEREVQRLRTFPYFVLNPPSVVSCRVRNSLTDVCLVDLISVTMTQYLIMFVFLNLYVFGIATLLIIIVALYDLQSALSAFYWN